jgi:hypothetical protein
LALSPSWSAIFFVGPAVRDQAEHLDLALGQSGRSPSWPGRFDATGVEVDADLFEQGASPGKCVLGVVVVSSFTLGLAQESSGSSYLVGHLQFLPLGHGRL